MGMVNKGFGFSMFPQLVLESAPFELARVELEIPTHRELALAVRSHGLASMATKAFIEYVRQWMSEEWNPQGQCRKKPVKTPTCPSRR